MPNEPEVIIQREHKRQKALELQEAIKQQLQERERKRKEEKEIQLAEERKLELRLEKQQEIEKMRIEEEKRKQKEKEEQENKKSKAMAEALAMAEQQAKEAKSKKNKISNDVLAGVDNEANTSSRKREYQAKMNQDHNRRNNNDKNLKTEDDQNTKNFANKCDAHTSLTAEKYFEEFKISIPLVNTQWTQTNSLCSLIKTKKNKCKSNGNRPQWGVNRPNTKYMKQSEKDPFYKRRIICRSHRRRQFEQEPSGSSHSFDSTDESKSMSSSPREKDFNLNVKFCLKKKFQNSYSNNKVDATALNYGSENDDDAIGNSETRREENETSNIRMNCVSTNVMENTQHFTSPKEKCLDVENKIQDLSTNITEIALNP